ncbi:MAG: PAS domain S-box protein [Candidatus Marinimicrobia bacterium]|nr:PAS domain S-box protein [Candidatus Neomarinimicrobiota bacterium]
MIEKRQKIKIQELQNEIYQKDRKIKDLEDELKYYMKYQFISNAAEDIMTLINHKFEYVAVNNAYCREHNKLKSEIIGKKVSDLWDKDIYNNKLKDILKRSFNGEIIHYQDWFKFENNKEGYYDVVYYPYYDDNEEITHVAVVTRDITKLKTTELELKKSESKYRNLIEGSFDMILRMDKNFILTFVSSASSRLFNISSDDLVGKDFTDIFVEEDKNKVLETLELLQRGNNVEAIQLRLRISPRDFRFIELNASPIFEGEIVMGHQGVVRDLTQRMKLEEKQRHLEAELIKEHRLAAIGMLTSGLAHNIRSPLTAIMGAVQLFKMGSNDLDNMEIIQSSARKIQKITDSMMVKLRKESDEEKQEISINELFMNELEMLQANLDFKYNVTTETYFAEKIPMIFGVYNHFSQAFGNIIQNAIDAMYSSEEKKLTIRTSYVKDMITIEISDTGYGIKEENLEKLFDPFFTTKPKTNDDKSKAPTGTGLGLYSCYNLLKPYSAKIDVRSELGAGTTFIISIPVEINQ